MSSVLPTIVVKNHEHELVLSSGRAVASASPRVPLPLHGTHTYSLSPRAALLTHTNAHAHTPLHTPTHSAREPLPPAAAEEALLLSETRLAAMLSREKERERDAAVMAFPTPMHAFPPSTQRDEHTHHHRPRSAMNARKAAMPRQRESERERERLREIEAEREQAVGKAIALHTRTNEREKERERPKTAAASVPDTHTHNKTGREREKEREKDPLFGGQQLPANENTPRTDALQRLLLDDEFSSTQATARTRKNDSSQAESETVENHVRFEDEKNGNSEKGIAMEREVATEEEELKRGEGVDARITREDIIQVHLPTMVREMLQPEDPLPSHKVNKKALRGIVRGSVSGNLRRGILPTHTLQQQRQQNARPRSSQNTARSDNFPAASSQARPATAHPAHTAQHTLRLPRPLDDSFVDPSVATKEYMGNEGEPASEERGAKKERAISPRLHVMQLAHEILLRGTSAQPRTPSHKARTQQKIEVEVRAPSPREAEAMTERESAHALLPSDLHAQMQRQLRQYRALTGQVDYHTTDAQPTTHTHTHTSTHAGIEAQERGQVQAHTDQQRDPERDSSSPAEGQSPRDFTGRRAMIIPSAHTQTHSQTNAEKDVMRSLAVLRERALQRRLCEENEEDSENEVENDNLEDNTEPNTLTQKETLTPPTVRWRAFLLSPRTQTQVQPQAQPQAQPQVGQSGQDVTTSNSAVSLANDVPSQHTEGEEEEMVRPASSLLLKTKNVHLSDYCGIEESESNVSFNDNIDTDLEDKQAKKQAQTKRTPLLDASMPAKRNEAFYEDRYDPVYLLQREEEELAQAEMVLIQHKERERQRERERVISKGHFLFDVQESYDAANRAKKHNKKTSEQLSNANGSQPQLAQTAERELPQRPLSREENARTRVRVALRPFSPSSPHTLPTRTARSPSPSPSPNTRKPPPQDHQNDFVTLALDVVSSRVDDQFRHGLPPALSIKRQQPTIPAGCSGMAFCEDLDEERGEGRERDSASPLSVHSPLSPSTKNKKTTTPSSATTTKQQSKSLEEDVRLLLATSTISLAPRTKEEDTAVARDSVRKFNQRVAERNRDKHKPVKNGVYSRARNKSADESLLSMLSQQESISPQNVAFPSQISDRSMM